MEERPFTWFPKLTRVLQSLPAEAVAEFALAITAYGTAGTEPEFTTPWLLAVFEGVREDIDHSISARTKNKGGRPSKKGDGENRRENGGFEKQKPTETPVSGNENQFQNPETPVSQNENQFPKAETPVSGKPQNTKPVSENGNPPLIIHNSTEQYRTVQDSTVHTEKTNLDVSGCSDAGDGFPAFLHAALDAWNGAMGQTVLAFPEKARLGLRQAFDNGRTPDDLARALANARRDWEPRYITPGSVFGGNFESLLNRGDPPDDGGLEGHGPRSVPSGGGW